MDANIIRAGDIVNVYFNRSDAEFSVKIICSATPEEPVWNCERFYGTPVNISHYEKMVRTKPAEKEPETDIPF